MIAEVTVEEKAALLVSGIDSTLRNGHLHFRESDKKLLTTTREILETMLMEGKIIFQVIRNRFNR